MKTFTPRELYSSGTGTVFRAEVQVADESGGFWLIWDLDGRELGAIEDHHEQGWKHSSLPIGLPRGPFASFEEALVDRLTAIRASGGAQSDDLYWEGPGMPRLDQGHNEKHDDRDLSSKE
ncbi:hypothetical protein [Arthrobacter woluwensis]|uniref:Uncharacterized protein n=1 Tax=Arthrobacter woluwensis TaxID=156980 RepID=A0A1H4I7X8_9MICC|nr:hypothetical protein [Arthrobacter woluwensis]SEB30081.1 hypothetical protein SAMN04489745_0107 [Arthrobacter woluwensis]